MTSTDTAKNLLDWSVYGVDRSCARYVLYDAKGHYACFDRQGAFILPPARVIRCMNVLLYYGKDARKGMRSSMGALLDKGAYWFRDSTIHSGHTRAMPPKKRIRQGSNRVNSYSVRTTCGRSASCPG